MRISSPLCVVLSGLSVFVNLSRAARNVTVDNTNPLITYSPQPCYITPPPNCSPEWQLTVVPGAFNGTTTSTDGNVVASGLDILPRVTFTFQGISILYVPGSDSNATATVAVDDLPSVLVDTSHNAFSGVGLNPSIFHTITITFTPPPDGTREVLSVDYFVVGEDDNNNSSSTSATSTVLTPAPIPSPTTTSTSTTTTSSTTLPFLPTVSAQPQDDTTSRPAPGTIAAISLSGVLVLLFGGMAWLFTSQRRRQRHLAVMREAEILQGTRMPSSRGQEEAATGFQPSQRH